MTPGKFYVWPGCFTLDLQGRPSQHLRIFGIMEGGKLWPDPVVGVNVSKEPEGEGIPLIVLKRGRKFRFN